MRGVDIGQVLPAHMVLSDNESFNSMFKIKFIENSAAMQPDVLFKYTWKILLSQQLEYEGTLSSSSTAIMMSTLDLLKVSMLA